MEVVENKSIINALSIEGRTCFVLILDSVQRGYPAIGFNGVIN